MDQTILANLIVAAIAVVLFGAGVASHLRVRRRRMRTAERRGAACASGRGRSEEPSPEEAE